MTSWSHVPLAPSLLSFSMFFPVYPASSQKLRTNEISTPPTSLLRGLRRFISTPSFWANLPSSCGWNRQSRKGTRSLGGKHNTADCWGGCFQNGHSLERQCGPADKPPETWSFRRIWSLQRRGKASRGGNIWTYCVAAQWDCFSTYTITNVIIKKWTYWPSCGCSFLLYMFQGSFWSVWTKFYSLLIFRTYVN